MKNTELTDVIVVLKYRTVKAVLVDHGDTVDVWLPLSQIEIEPNADGRTHTVTLPQWLAEDKGIV
jgi:hypothetical protein